jgi:Ca2+-binding RTX toxin-like protein
MADITYTATLASGETVFGGTGNDVLAGYTGADYINAGIGNNNLFGDTGNDRLISGSGNDTLNGGTGDDVVLGGSGNNSLDGGTGNDYITSGSGTDIMLGGTGNDYMNSGAGGDSLDGGTGIDTIIGGAGQDTMTGGTETDTFTYLKLSESSLALPDQITDFLNSSNGAQADKISFAAVDSNATTTGVQHTFSFIGTATAFSGADATGQIYFDSATHTLYASDNADSTAEFALILTGVAVFTAADLILI